MATSIIQKPIRSEIKTFSVDSTTFTQSSQTYGGVLTLTAEELDGASAIIPLWARKAGYVSSAIVGFENGSIRLTTLASMQGVTVGLLYLYF